MSEQQTIAYPSHCLVCKADRFMIGDGAAYYRCGTKITLIRLTKRLHVTRTQKCIEGTERQGELNGQHQTERAPQS